MNMPKFVAIAVYSLTLTLCALPLPAQDVPSVVVFREVGFPAADAPSVSKEPLEKLLPGAQFASADQLGVLLADPVSRSLVLPCGSAFPEQDWSAIYSFLGSLPDRACRRPHPCGGGVEPRRYRADNQADV
jgi:hypothetical protein